LDLIDNLKHKFPYCLVQTTINKTRTFDNIYNFVSYFIKIKNNLDFTTENNLRNNSTNTSASREKNNHNNRNSRGSYYNITIIPYTLAGISTRTTIY
jgi:hypothetical protein